MTNPEIPTDPELAYHLEIFAAHCDQPCEYKVIDGWRACLKCCIEYDELNN